MELTTHDQGIETGHAGFDLFLAGAISISQILYHILNPVPPPLIPLSKYMLEINHLPYLPSARYPI